MAITICTMLRKAAAVSTLPDPVSRSLTQLSLAHNRRKETIAAFAERMQVTARTLPKRGHEALTVSIAVNAIALGRLKWLPEIANAVADEVATQRPATVSQAQWKKP